MLLQIPHIMATAIQKTGDVLTTSWRETARGLIISLYEGTDLHRITVYCSVLMILGIIGGILIIAFAVAARKKADLYYLTRMELYGDNYLYRSVR